MILGAALGWAFHKQQSPIFEADAILSSNIDLTRVGKLTDTEYDHAFGAIGDVLQSDIVRVATLAKGQEQGISISLAKWNQMAFSERKVNQYILRVRTNNPQQAAQLANFWLDVADQTIQESLQHARLAEGLERYLDGLTSCLQQSLPASSNGAICSDDLQKIQAEMEQTGLKLREEKQASHGISPAMTSSISSRAEIPTSASLYLQGAIMLAGAGLGYLLALIGVFSGWFGRLSGK